jgi:glycosyltransferase involved in cell wall biosynthesis
MKVVLLHDWLTGFRGGERVLEAFCELFPDAPLYTLLWQPKSSSEKIENREIVTSFLDKIPGIHTQYRKFLPLFPRAAKSMRIVHQADLILSSSHAMIKAVPRPSGMKHLCYVHSPMRYIYDQFDVYFGKDAGLAYRVGGLAVRDYLTREDKKSNLNVDRFLANSTFVQKRIEKFYGRESRVVHPFVELDDFSSVRVNAPVKQEFHVMVTAFAPNKRVDLAIQAFNELKKPLKIIGSGQDEKRLKQLAGPYIGFLGNADRATVVRLLSQARSLVFPGVEDFGITPLEALAAGTPVIAFKAGGVLDTLDDSTAQFFDEPSVEVLKKAIVEFEKRQFDRSVLVARAQQFSKDVFKEKIMKEIEVLFR